MCRSFLTIFAIAALFFSCKATEQTAGESQPASETCFEKLHSSSVEKGKVQQISYLHGQCKEGYHALNKITQAKKIYADVAGDVEELELLVKGKSVSFKHNGENIDVGTLEDSEKGGKEIALKDNIQLGLMVGDDEGDLHLWTLADKMKSFKTERILLTVE